MATKAPKPKKCCMCSTIFTPERIGQKVCGYKCAGEFAKLESERKYKAETVVMRKNINDNDPKWHAKRTKTICHLFIRTRDAGKGCKSCGTKESRQWDAGHYIPSHRGSALRYDERNIHLQCCVCNDGSKLSGNLTMYRMALVRDHGEEYVQELERIGHTKKTWTIPELIDVHDYYKQKLKDIKADCVA